jgi:RNA polymerase primary sigma factor
MSQKPSARLPPLTEEATKKPSTGVEEQVSKTPTRVQPVEQKASTKQSARVEEKVSKMPSARVQPVQKEAPKMPSARAEEKLPEMLSTPLQEKVPKMPSARVLQKVPTMASTRFQEKVPKIANARVRRKVPKMKLSGKVSKPSITPADTFTRADSEVRYAPSTLGLLTTTKRLLTAEDEQKYGKLVQLLSKFKAVEKYALKATGQQPTVDEVASILKLEKASFIKIKHECEEARRIMMDCNVRLVISMAKKRYRANSGNNVEDLVSAGMSGLTLAVDKFDPSKGHKFSTYAYWWIRVSVDRFLREHRPVQVPTHYWEALSKIRKADRALREELKRKPTHSQIGELLGMDPKKVQEIITACRDADSLDQTFMNSDSTRGASMEETLVVEHRKAYDPLDTVKQEESGHAQSQVQTLLSSALTSREKEILGMRYGLEGTQALTLDELADRLQVSRTQVRVTLEKIFRKLRLTNRKLALGLSS